MRINSEIAEAMRDLDGILRVLVRLKRQNPHRLTGLQRRIDHCLDERLRLMRISDNQCRKITRQPMATSKR